MRIKWAANRCIWRSYSILFIIFINDLGEKEEILKFTDDTKLSETVKFLEAGSKVQNLIHMTEK